MYLEKSCIRSLLFLLCAFEICKESSNRSNSQEVVNGNTICVGYGWWARWGGGGSTLIKIFASVLHTLNPGGMKQRLSHLSAIFIFIDDLH